MRPHPNNHVHNCLFSTINGIKKRKHGTTKKSTGPFHGQFGLKNQMCYNEKLFLYQKLFNNAKLYLDF